MKQVARTCFFFPAYKNYNAMVAVLAASVLAAETFLSNTFLIVFAF